MVDSLPASGSQRSGPVISVRLSTNSLLSRGHVARELAGSLGSLHIGAQDLMMFQYRGTYDFNARPCGYLHCRQQGHSSHACLCAGYVGTRFGGLTPERALISEICDPFQKVSTRLARAKCRSDWARFGRRDRPAAYSSPHPESQQPCQGEHCAQLHVHRAPGLNEAGRTEDGCCLGGLLQKSDRAQHPKPAR